MTQAHGIMGAARNVKEREQRMRHATVFHIAWKGCRLMEAFHLPRAGEEPLRSGGSRLTTVWMRFGGDIGSRVAWLGLTV